MNMTETAPAEGEVVRVLLADPSWLVRTAVRRILESGGLSVSDEAGTVAQLLMLAKKLRPELVIMEAEFAGHGERSVVEACRTLARSGVRVLVLADRAGAGAGAEAGDRCGLAARLIYAGAAGYLPKSAGAGELAEAAKAVAGGEYRLPRWFMQWLLERTAHLRTGTVPVPAQPLTPRQADLVRLFAQGGSYAEIAQAKGKSQYTIRNQLYSIRGKLGLRRWQDLVLWAERHGLLMNYPPFAGDGE